MVIKPIGLGEIHFEELLEEILTEYLEEFKSSVVRFCGFLPDTGCKWNVHKTFRRRPGRFLDILSMFNIHPVPGGVVMIFVLIFSWRLVSERNQLEQQGVG